MLITNNWKWACLSHCRFLLCSKGLFRKYLPWIRPPARQLHFHATFSSSIPSQISRPHFGASTEHLPILSCRCNWDSFLQREAQTAADRLYSFLHECLGSITVEQTHWLPSKMNSHDRIRCKRGKLQKSFLLPGTFLWFYDSVALRIPARHPALPG